MEKELVKLATFSTDAEAHIVAGMLEENGITSMLTNQTMSAVLPIGFNSIGGVTVYVNADDVAEARRLLDSHDD